MARGDVDAAADVRAFFGFHDGGYPVVDLRFVRESGRTDRRRANAAVPHEEDVEKIVERIDRAEAAVGAPATGG